MLTILIPTMNRSDFIIRQLEYYAQSGYKHWISIGDSSDARHLKTTKEALKKFSGQLKIIYYEYPGFNDSQCLKKLIETTQTPYAVYAADDDFLVPEGLEKSVAFLERNPDYSCAHGSACMLSLGNSGPYGKICALWDYDLPVLNQDRACERLLEHMGHYTVALFCVHRSGIWRKMFQNTVVLDRSFAGEILPGCLSAIYGKSVKIDGLYLIRHVHDRNYSLPDVFDWITSPGWSSSYRDYSNCLIEELSNHDGISPDVAGKAVKQANWLYLNTFSNIQYKHEFIKSAQLKSKLKKSVFLQNYLLPLWHFSRKARYRMFASYKITLEGILSNHSPYRKDFLPVYKVITKGVL